MKHAIFIILGMAILLSCHESNSVEPILDNAAKQNQWDGSLDKKKGFILVRLSCKYNFDPDANNQQCGGLMCGTSLRYSTGETSKDGTIQRYIRGAQIYSPSIMVINGKTYNTFHVYTLNRDERITQDGKVLSGNTWGTFRIVENNGLIPTKKKSRDVVLFKGEFTGDIVLNNAKIRLKGVGETIYRNYRFQAIENQICNNSNGSLKCWSSAIHGQITVPIITDY